MRTVFQICRGSRAFVYNGGAEKHLESNTGFLLINTFCIILKPDIKKSTNTILTVRRKNRLVALCKKQNGCAKAVWLCLERAGAGLVDHKEKQNMLQYLFLFFPNIQQLAEELGYCMRLLPSCWIVIRVAVAPKRGNTRDVCVFVQRERFGSSSRARATPAATSYASAWPRLIPVRACIT